MTDHAHDRIARLQAERRQPPAPRKPQAWTGTGRTMALYERAAAFDDRRRNDRASVKFVGLWSGRA